MGIERIHHVAYRCHDAKATVEWYRQHLGMDFVLAIAEDRVPSTHAPDPYMHVFLDAGGGNILAFFELPNSPAMGRDGNRLTEHGIADEAGHAAMHDANPWRRPLHDEQRLVIRGDGDRSAQGWRQRDFRTDTRLADDAQRAALALEHDHALDTVGQAERAR